MSSAHIGFRHSAKSPLSVSCSMAKIRDITGLRFGRLLALREQPPRNGRQFWLFECECGSRKVINKSHAVCGRIVSCGCYVVEISKSEQNAERCRTLAVGAGRHNMSTTPVYAVWKSMRQRCKNPKSPDFKWYGALGIRVCKRWDDFPCFLADMGERPDGMTIERRNPSGHYEPGNCYWAPWEVQRTNKRKHHAGN